MNYRKHGLKALGLSLLTALGLMAFTAVGAQAADWLIGGKALTGLAASESVTGEQVGTENNLLILKLNLTLQCAEAEVGGATIKAGGTGSGTISFSECHVLDAEKKEAACTLVEPIEAAVNAEVVLHEGGNYVLFKPQGEAFAVVETTGGVCPLPEEAEVKGSVLAKVTTNNARPMVISTSGTLGLLSTGLQYGVHVSHLTATANVFNAGPYALATLGVH